MTVTQPQPAQQLFQHRPERRPRRRCRAARDLGAVAVGLATASSEAIAARVAAM